MLSTMLTVAALSHEAERVVAYWRAAGPHNWFGKDPDFDRELREQLIAVHERAASQALESWVNEPVSAMALVLLLDQFPRNAFRGTERMYATDTLAKRYASRAVELGFDLEIGADLQLFFYLPFAHSEDLADQERSVRLHERLGYTANARRHRDIIRRFGRFPHRNPILSREMTSAEQAYLDGGGFAG